ncbi:MAG TPA: OmpH family outer membrane protein, partial [Vampirovibrionales bacterium]
SLKNFSKALLVTAIFVLSPISSFAGEIGIVNNARLYELSPEAQKAQKEILDERESLQKRFAELSAELESALKDTNLSEADKLQKRKSAQEEFELEKKRLDDIIQTRRESIEKSILKAIQSEASSQGLDMVVSSNVVFYGGKDITEKVLTRLK